ncbi:MAG: radical SAM protein [Bacillota bacterium]|nr:radical SAM protein [Bacillota bacterium]MDW7677785.1 radical SAM protein [Bacillota bacterium]
MSYEIGPIRPPSEAASLLLRITRNCPWNQCRFCSLYKGESFSVRSKEDVFQDIDTIKRFVEAFRQAADEDSAVERSRMNAIKRSVEPEDERAYYMARNWYGSGMKSVFIQDANSLVMKASDLIDILYYIRDAFPEIERITCYARSHTVARMRDEDLQEMAAAGLNRIHIGMETACDEVLQLIKKGVDKETHIRAGQKIKKTTMELSEYYMPGLGGEEYSRKSAWETADALNQINPDYIRIRTLVVKGHSLLHDDYQDGTFTRTNDVEMVQELMWMIEKLEGITSTLKSDHIINLLPEVEGTFPEDKAKMLAVLKWFLSLPASEQMIFRIGRRTGVMTHREDLANEVRRRRVQQMIRETGITVDNVDQITDALIQRYI